MRVSTLTVMGVLVVLSSSARSTVVAGELTEVASELLGEVTSPVNDWIQPPANTGVGAKWMSHESASVLSLNDSPGTLFQWS